MISQLDAPLICGINGFGRIGRLCLRAALHKAKSVEPPTHTLRGLKRCPIVNVINNPGMTVEQAAYLFKYDSVHGQYHGAVTCHTDEKNTFLIVDGYSIKFYHEMDASKISWSADGVEIVLETSGHYTSTEKACVHNKFGGVSKVIISAPPSDSVTPTLVLGVNEDMYNASEHHVVSNASCTTNCLAPLVKIMNDAYGIEEGLMTTIHATTASQQSVDGITRAGKDWRAGRQVSDNIIPASTGAARALGDVIPALKGKMTGIAMRVPVSDVSVVDITMKLQQPTTLEEVATLFTTASQDPKLSHIIGVTRDPVVSSDFKGDTRSCILDINASLFLNDTFCKLVAYYDNEMAYAHRMIDLAVFMKVSSKGG